MVVHPQSRVISCQFKVVSLSLDVQIEAHEIFQALQLPWNMFSEAEEMPSLCGARD
jgi:hypothetical protein